MRKIWGAGLAVVAACSGGPAPDDQDAEHALESAVAHHEAGRMEAEAVVLRAAIASSKSASAPALADLHARLGYVYRYAGLMEESIREYRQAQMLDSTASRAITVESQIAKSLIYLGRYQEAIAAHATVYGVLDQQGAAMDEKLLFYDGIAHLYDGRSADAVRLLDASIDAGGSVWSLFAQGYRHAVGGQQEALRAVAVELEQRDDIADGERRYRLVHLFALSGDTERALDHLDAAIAAGFFNAPYIDADPLLASVRSTDRFARLFEGARTRHREFGMNHE